MSLFAPARSCFSTSVLGRGGTSKLVRPPVSPPSSSSAAAAVTVRLLATLQYTNVAAHPTQQQCRSPHALSSSTARPRKPAFPNRIIVLQPRRGAKFWFMPKLFKDGPPYRAIDHYDKLPTTYKDSEGLEYREGELTADEVRRIFGPYMTPADANRLCRIMHGRRVAGTLDDPKFWPNTQQFTPREIQLALAHVREAVPVDEDLNAGLRAEDELNDIDPEVLQKIDRGEKVVLKPFERPTVVMTAAKEAKNKEAEKDKKQKKKKQEKIRRSKDGREAKKVEVEEVQEEDPEYVPDPIYGHSILDEVQHKKKIIEKKREKLLAAELQRRREEFLASGQKLGPLSIVDEAGQLRMPQLHQMEMSAQMVEWQRAGQSDLKEPPQMSTAARLLPSVAFLALLAGVGYVCWSEYVPPSERERMVQRLSLEWATIVGLAAVNTLVWLAWKIPPWWGFLNKNLIVVAATPRPLQLLLAVFSHQSFAHLASNVLVGLLLAGPPLVADVGRADFFATYLAGGVLGNFVGLAKAVALKDWAYCSHGASAGVLAIVMAYFYLHRFEGFKIFGLPPDPFEGVPGMGFMGLVLGVNVWALFSRGHNIDVVTHWTGILVGMAAGWLMQDRYKARKEETKKQRTGVDGEESDRDKEEKIKDEDKGWAKFEELKAKVKKAEEEKRKAEGKSTEQDVEGETKEKRMANVQIQDMTAK